MDFDYQRYKDIFERSGCPGEAGAALLLRLQLLLAIKDQIQKQEWSQQEAARILRIKQPRISEINAMRIDKFSVELLVKYLYRLRYQVQATVSPSVKTEVR